jgi:hypothetical protein
MQVARHSGHLLGGPNGIKRDVAVPTLSPSEIRERGRDCWESCYSPDLKTMLTCGGEHQCGPLIPAGEFKRDVAV